MIDQYSDDRRGWARFSDDTDVLEVVNLFALRSPYPADLKKCACGFRGDDAVNDVAILQACHGASVVIAAWGAHGALDRRDLRVLNMLRDAKVHLHHLGTTKDGFPKHPWPAEPTAFPATNHWSNGVRNEREGLDVTAISGRAESSRDVVW